MRGSPPHPTKTPGKPKSQLEDGDNSSKTAPLPTEKRGTSENVTFEADRPRQRIDTPTFTHCHWDVAKTHRNTTNGSNRTCTTPGSGKSAPILEAAIWAAKRGLHVLIVCPTGQLVHSFKSQLPDVQGVEHIQVDTLAGALNYQRPGVDQKVRWAPPTALRKIGPFEAIRTRADGTICTRIRGSPPPQDTGKTKKHKSQMATTAS